MSAVHRREFLSAAVPLALSLGLSEATSPPPPKAKGKFDDGMPPCTGSEELPMPLGATRRLGTSRMRLPGHVSRIAMAPKGTTLIGASSKEIRGWDPKTGKVLFRLEYPPDSSVSSGRLTNRDSFALIVRPNSGGQTFFCHYEFGTGKLIAKSPPLTHANSQFEALSPDGSLMAVGTEQSIALLETATLKERWKETVNPGPPTGWSYFDDGSMIAIAYRGEVQLWSAATGKKTATLKVELPPKKKENAADAQPNDIVSSPTASPDGRWLAALTGPESKTACLWEIKSGKIQHTFTPVAKIIGFDKKSAELVTYHQAKVTFWNLADGKSRSVEVPNESDIEMVPDGSLLASSTEDCIVITDTKTGKATAYSSDPPGLPDRLQFTNTHLMGRLSTWGGWVRWDLKTGTAQMFRGRETNGKSPIAVSRDGKRGVYQDKFDFELHELETGKPLARLKADGAGANLQHAAISADGHSMYGWRSEAFVQMNAGETKDRIIPRPEEHGAVSGIALADNQRFAAVGINNHGARGWLDVYDLTEFKFVKRLELSGDSGAIAWTPDAQWLAVSHAGDAPEGRFGDQGTATVFDMSTGKPRLQIPPENHREHVIAISPNGRMLARMEQDNQIAIWEVLSNSVRRRFDAGGAVSSIAFSPDGRMFAASVSGAPVFLWDLHAPGWRIPISARRMEAAWNDLRSPDAKIAFEAMRLFTADSAASIPFLKERAAPVESPDTERMRKWVDDLDHKEFRKREAAMKGLGEMGDKARGLLRDTLGKTIPTETRERIERLLAANDKPTPDQLRQYRVVEAMEAIGSPDAAALLKHWSSGAAGSSFTKAAAEAHKRWMWRQKG